MPTKIRNSDSVCIFRKRFACENNYCAAHSTTQHKIQRNNGQQYCRPIQTDRSCALTLKRQSAAADGRWFMSTRCLRKTSGFSGKETCYYVYRSSIIYRSSRIDCLFHLFADSLGCFVVRSSHSVRLTRYYTANNSVFFVRNFVNWFVRQTLLSTVGYNVCENCISEFETRRRQAEVRMNRP